MRNGRLIGLALTLLAFSAPVVGQKRSGVIWRDPGNMASLDLLYGAGGKEDAPNPTGRFKFVKEDLEATSPKFEVKDDQGVEWRVKLGQEPRSETAATRFLWAAGYFVDEDYYLAEVHVTGLPKLQRGESFASANGMVRGARFERKTKAVAKDGSWTWFDNPFVGTREFNGLRAMMSLLDNWDLSTANNSIYEVAGESRYVVSDVGATFGNTGNNFTRSKSVPRDYQAAKFIESATPAFIDLTLHSRPFFVSVINVSNYRDRTRMEQVTKHIPRADVAWLGHRLALLSEEQVRDAFRAAGYAASDVEMYAKAIRKRIADLDAL